MASLSCDRDGRKRIQFKDAEGKRQTLRLGVMPKARALSVKQKVEDLISSRLSGLSPSEDTAKWLAKLDKTLRERLITLGLADRRKRRKRKTARLEKFIDRYIAKRGDVKESTRKNYRYTRGNLIKFFGADKRLRDITLGDAEDFRNQLLADGLGDSTVRKRCAIASQFMGNALKHKLVDENPFVEVPKNVKGSKRRAYVPAVDAEKVLNQLPTTEWKLLFVLSRWGGLCVGSEVRRLRWQDIDWENDRFLVHSPKTEHIEGHETRMVPLFPEVAQLLRERLEQAADGDELVLPMLAARQDAALRKTVMRAAKRAGVAQWTRLWHSLRASRQTDLEDLYPSKKVCAWLGNSEEVARENYVMVTDNDFRIASGKATQNPTQPIAEEGCTAAHAQQAKTKKPANTAIAVPASLLGSPGGTNSQ